ncbi:D-sedoheptulose 7-phosphate isomerase [Roseivirga pacifica]|uniref:D-sedoheptulose 7-phosphate isomerase n=1 Tax=Roseivirga pacifica TaxID=1267423 RepID=UPI0020958DF3|nr:D-sedoheptulose 7-phosphate isomerase [Roseivirga pacifica]MCO6359625.1 D-sedoheptulose 7-phosphate isomerase [Roseivirga pacifica]MCO6366995.1 D-sedoheptulose 7-phosphate isomerase [Roseivirga pacifica]MCO6370473.1 D-sedoheptulose 7-phosphate isomerase [Roseivirga pacifica]MCO6374652.1 D-sedoheptulose 7-phosphate isomerase [Roseivirga pacifica]MCO6379910.1 D-sedoheptulose 7-phosphate isomerase [Roseivirga pacifica]
MDAKQLILDELNEAAKVLDQFLSNDANIAQIEKTAALMANAIKDGGKIFSCGNGGSHCDAMHFAEELTGRYREDRKALPAIAISDVSHISCVSNDFGYDFIFSRYIEGLGKEGDVLLAISTSGNSKNVLRAAEMAKQKKMKIVALTGKNGGDLRELADLEIRVPHYGYADRIQEIHIKVIHILIQLIEKHTVDTL